MITTGHAFAQIRLGGASFPPRFFSILAPVGGPKDSLRWLVFSCHAGCTQRERETERESERESQPRELLPRNLFSKVLRISTTFLWLHRLVLPRERTPDTFAGKPLFGVPVFPGALVARARSFFVPRSQFPTRSVGARVGEVSIFGWHARLVGTGARKIFLQNDVLVLVLVSGDVRQDELESACGVIAKW